MYQVFFREFVASQRAADQRRDKGENDISLRTLFQKRFGLDGFEQQMLSMAAQTCVAAQEASLKATQELAGQLKLNPNDAALKTQIGQLRAASRAAVTAGVQQLRSSLAPDRFARLDLMIRVHVMPNLRSSQLAGSAQAPPGGN